MNKHIPVIWFCALLVFPEAGLLPAAAGSGHPSANAAVDEISALPAFVADYELERNGMRAARLTRSLGCDDGLCEFRSEGQTVGLIDLLLRGRIEEWTRFGIAENGGIEPREYFYRQRARGGNNAYRRLFFSPATNRVSSRGDEQWEVAIEGETMDQLLSQLRLMQAVRAGRTEMTFSVVEDDGEVEEYHFEVMGTESVQTGAGMYDAIRVEHVGGSSKRRTAMWFAPELDYIPIIVRHERIGRETITATLIKVRE
ncbi:MAG: DUF3108 domain-containing protein [Aquisalimonadaceae bacterium]